MNALIKEFKDQNLLTNHLAVVVGAGSSGIAAARLLAELGARVRVVDRNEDTDPSVMDRIPGGELLLGDHSPQQFAGADIVVLSPGVPVKKMAHLLKDVPERKVVSELELACWFTQAPILAITGTNGKTTTTTLVSHILEHAGKTVFTGGNIGTPLCDYLLDSEQADVIVLEVSSFQLQNVRTFKPRVGMLLNFSANHLDYHETMEEYLDAKLMMFAQQDENDVAILPANMREKLEGYCPPAGMGTGKRIYFEARDLFDAPHLPGEHNQANITAAWTAVEPFGVTRDEAAKAIAEFHPLAHRQEPVGEVGGVRFVNDSKSTNLDSTIAAIQAMQATLEPGKSVHLLLGGVFKGGDAKVLLPSMRGVVTQVGLFGAGREHFEDALARECDLFWEPDLERATQRLMNDAEEGDVVLLSPATASFDAYKSYTERGDHFRTIVQNMIKHRGEAS